MERGEKRGEERENFSPDAEDEVNLDKGVVNPDSNEYNMNTYVVFVGTFNSTFTYKI